MRELRLELDGLVQDLYAELRAVARRAIRREGSGHTLQPTALVHEVYLRLASQREAGWATEEEFLAIAAGVMRRVLVDHARRKQAEKRGAAPAKVTLDLSKIAAGSTKIDLIELDEALDRMAAIEPRPAQVVEMRFFGGLELDQIARTLAVSTITVKRDWAWAKAWLFRQLGGVRDDARP